MNNPIEHIIATMSAAVAAARDVKIITTLLSLGFTFEDREALEAFVKDRLHLEIHGTTNRLFLDGMIPVCEWDTTVNSQFDYLKGTVEISIGKTN